MIRASSVLQEDRRVSCMAGRAEIAPDWAPVAAWVRTEITGGWDDSYATERFKSRGGRLVHGRGVMIGPRTVTVGDQSFTARRGIVIATGSKPAIPPIPGLTEVDYWTTHDVIQIEQPPKSLIILGGGAVGCELGQVLARFGVDVTIVEAGDRLLPAEESEASQALEAAFAAEGIDVHARVPLAEMRSMIYAFPTFFGGIGEAIGEYGSGLSTVLDPDYKGFEDLDAVGAAEGD